MYLVSARGKTGSMSVATETAALAIAKLRAFESEGFQAIVFDERGRECARELLEASLSDAARNAMRSAPTP